MAPSLAKQLRGYYRSANPVHNASSSLGEKLAATISCADVAATFASVVEHLLGMGASAVTLLLRVAVDLLPSLHGCDQHMTAQWSGYGKIKQLRSY